LHGTLVYLKNPIDYLAISDHLLKNGYEVYPQELEAALNFVKIIDYPRLDLKDWTSYLRKALWRLNVIIDDETLNDIVEKIKPEFELYDDAAEFLKKIKDAEFKIGVVTTIAEFRFTDTISPVKEFIDGVFTGSSCKCDKSNPKLYLHALKELGSKPEQAVIIGDEPLVDIYIPHRLGLKTVLLNRNGDLPEIREADGIVRDLREGAELIIKIR